MLLLPTKLSKLCWCEESLIEYLKKDDKKNINIVCSMLQTVSLRRKPSANQKLHILKRETLHMFYLDNI